MVTLYPIYFSKKCLVFVICKGFSSHFTIEIKAILGNKPNLKMKMKYRSTIVLIHNTIRALLACVTMGGGHKVTRIKISKIKKDLPIKSCSQKHVSFVFIVCQFSVNSTFVGRIRTMIK